LFLLSQELYIPTPRTDNLSFLLRCNHRNFSNVTYSSIYHDTISLVLMSRPGTDSTIYQMVLIRSARHGKWEVVLRGEKRINREETMLGFRNAAEKRVGEIVGPGDGLVIWSNGEDGVDGVV
jgi:hypothetical protein